MQIERLGLFPVAVDSGRSVGMDTSDSARRAAVLESLPKPVRVWLFRSRPPGLRELSAYSQQLSNLLKAGMPLTMALGSMASLDFKGIHADTTRQVRQDVLEGRSLSDAMTRQSGVFPHMMVNMVRAGEQSGSLVDVLRRLGEHYERFAEVRQKFTAALIYPCIVAFVGVVIVFFFMTKMLPSFVSIFQTMKDVDMPMSTQLLIDLSRAFTRWWWAMILAVIAGAVVFERFRATDYGARTLDRWKLVAPVLGRVMRLSLFGQFARTLSTLLQNGVPVLISLRITEQIMPNVILREAIAKTREAVTDGKTISQPLASSLIFPQLMIDLIRIGEETGDVPGALRNVAETYENDLEVSLRVLTNLIEPALIIVIACGVGFLLFSVLSAMFRITANIDRG
jgi:type II secretory pathway component PulF